MLTRTGRLLGLSALGAALALVGAACSADDDGTTAPTITIQPQSYQSKPPATLAPETTTEPTAGEDGTTDQVQHYTVQEDEYPAQIASKFEITLSELIEFNNWTLEGQIVPEFEGEGSVVEIPPGAKFIGPEEEEETEPTEVGESNGGTTTDGNAIGTIPGPVGTGDPADDRCVAGRYTVVDGDYPIGVAQKFDVSIDALNQANAGTAGYSTFYTGLEIIIPPAEDC
jgi:LysM repeat protein